MTILDILAIGLLLGMGIFGMALVVEILVKERGG